jgi:hypothetical protein
MKKVNVERSRLEFETFCFVNNEPVIAGIAEIFIPKS